MKKLMIMLALVLCFGCTQKHAKVTIPPILNEDGTIRIPQQTVEYDETNFFSEDKAEGIWFQYDEDGILLEFNKSETTMEAVLKAVEVLLPLVKPE